MSDTNQGASAPKFTTSRHSFETVNCFGDLLFEVRPGVPALDALENASCYLAAARNVALELACTLGSENERGFATFHLVDLAKAVVDAVITSLEEKEQSHE